MNVTNVMRGIAAVVALAPIAYFWGYFWTRGRFVAERWEVEKHAEFWTKWNRRISVKDETDVS